jgi:hypothetical protein
MRRIFGKKRRTIRPRTSSGRECVFVTGGVFPCFPNNAERSPLGFRMEYEVDARFTTPVHMCG